MSGGARPTLQHTLGSMCLSIGGPAQKQPWLRTPDPPGLQPTHARMLQVFSTLLSSAEVQLTHTLSVTEGCFSLMLMRKATMTATNFWQL